MVVLDSRIEMLWHQQEGREAQRENAPILDILKCQDRLCKLLEEYYRENGVNADEEVRRVACNFARSEAKITAVRRTMQSEIERVSEWLDEQESSAIFIQVHSSLMESLLVEISVSDLELSVYLDKWCPVLTPQQKSNLQNMRERLHKAKELALSRQTHDGATSNRGSEPLQVSLASIMRRKSASVLDLSRRSEGEYSNPATWVEENETLGRPVEADHSSKRNSLSKEPRTENTMRREAMSFSSTLYQPTRARVGSIRDIGSCLRIRPVKGDGRCLFRSVAKGRAYCTGQIRCRLSKICP